MNFRFLATKQKPVTVGSALVTTGCLLLITVLKLLPVRPYLWLHISLMTILFFFTAWTLLSWWLCWHPERESRSVHVWGLIITVSFTVIGIVGSIVLSRYLLF